MNYRLTSRFTRSATAVFIGLCLLVWLGLFQLAMAQSTATESNNNDAAVLQRLDNFSNQLKTFSADFVQTLYGADSSVLQSNRGSVVLKRPGKFLWSYSEEDAQEIISDGKNIWLLDKELEQVTVSPLEERVGGTPLVLLMGNASLDDQFSISTRGQADGIDWIELTPLDNGADFETIFIGLKGSVLSAMELRDNFGQATQIQFSNYNPDIALEDDLFNFVPPEGIDVIGEAVQ